MPWLYLFEWKICFPPDLHLTIRTHVCFLQNRQISPAPAPAPGPGPGTAPSAYLYSGKATQYEDDLPSDGAADFACSFPYISPWAQQYYVAVNVEQWDSGKNCGRCVKASCTDPRCGTQQEVVAYVVDQCATCKYGDLDFGSTPWGDLTAMTPDRVQISWNFTSCHSYINDTIHVRMQWLVGGKHVHGWFLFSLFQVPGPARDG